MKNSFSDNLKFSFNGNKWRNCGKFRIEYIWIRDFQLNLRYLIEFEFFKNWIRDTAVKKNRQIFHYDNQTNRAISRIKQTHSLYKSQNPYQSVWNGVNWICHEKTRKQTKYYRHIPIFNWSNHSIRAWTSENTWPNSLAHQLNIVWKHTYQFA